MLRRPLSLKLGHGYKTVRLFWHVKAAHLLRRRQMRAQLLLERQVMTVESGSVCMAASMVRVLLLVRQVLPLFRCLALVLVLIVLSVGRALQS